MKDFLFGLLALLLPALLVHFTLPNVRSAYWSAVDQADGMLAAMLTAAEIALAAALASFPTLVIYWRLQEVEDV